MYFMMEALIQREFASPHPTITPQRMGDISPSRPWPNAPGTSRWNYQRRNSFHLFRLQSL